MSRFRTPAVVLLSGLLLPSFLPSCDCGGQDTGTPSTSDTDNQNDPYAGSDRGQYLSMATLPDGSPAVAFYNRTKGGLEFGVATVQDDGTATWRYEQVDGFADETGLDTGDRGQYASLAVSDAGVAWIAYYDAGNAALRYARRTYTFDYSYEDAARSPLGTSWESGTADSGGGSDPDAGKWASLALDPDGNPVVAHYDAGEGELRVARWNGSGFDGEVVDSGEDYTGTNDTGGTEELDADVGSYAHLLIDEDGTEYIAYYDAAWGRLLLATGTAGSYTVTTVDDDGDVGQWPSMILDEDGTLHIAYHEVEDQDLRYATGTPGSFTVTTVDDGEYAGADTSLFERDGNPAILYFSGLENDVKLATSDGSAWTTETLDGEEAALGFHNEAQVSGDDTFLACYDYTNRTLWFHTLE